MIIIVCNRLVLYVFGGEYTSLYIPNYASY